MADDDAPTIGFRSDGEWSGSDLADFAAATTGIYNALLVVRVRSRLEVNYLDALESAARRYERQIGHPMYHEMFRAWRESLHLWRKRSDTPPPFLLLPPFAFGYTDAGFAVPSDEEILRHLGRYTSPEERFRVHKIRHASPGGFSFQGIGEIVEQFRELIKDVWWRNRHERAEGDLDLLEKYLRMRRDNPDVNLPLPTYLRKDRYLAEVLQKELLTLHEMEDRGKLQAVPQHLDYIPDE